MNTRTLPDGSTITYTGHSRLWVLTDGTALRSEGYGPWEPSEPLFPAQLKTAPGGNRGLTRRSAPLGGRSH